MLRTETDVLGPGRRVLLWVHGCHRGCPGCIAAGWNAAEPRLTLSVSTLTEQILTEPELEGITISGGEPFLQAEALCELVTRLRERRKLGVILYTGFCLEELQKDPRTASLLALADAVIDGEYREELDRGEGWRGSENQRLHLLTDHYTETQIHAMRRSEAIVVDGNERRIVGIPSRALAKAWQQMAK